MAFKRLGVQRSAGLVWFGAIVLVFVFAGTQASYPSLSVMLRRIELVGALYVLGAALGAYCVFRGIYGAWWRVVRIDLDARELKTCLGEVISLDRLGTLSSEGDGTVLRAANAQTPVYRSTSEDVARARAMLEDVIRPGGTKHLHRLRRLTYHRSIGLFVVTFIGFALLTAVVIGEAHTTLREFWYEPEYKLMILVGYSVCLLWFRRALFGTFTQHQLFVDPIAGVLRLAGGAFYRLDELGELSIKKRADAYTGRRHTLTNYELHASNVDGVVYTEWDEARTQKRFDALSAAVLQFKLRRALEAPEIEADAFRGGIDPKDVARRIAGDSPYKQAALAALARDPDPTVRSRAAALR